MSMTAALKSGTVPIRDANIPNPTRPITLVTPIRDSNIEAASGVAPSWRANSGRKTNGMNRAVVAHIQPPHLEDHVSRPEGLGACVLITESWYYFLLSQNNVHYEMLPAAIDLHLGRIVTIHRGKGRDGDAGAAL